METVLTSDRFFLLTFFFWMFAGCILLFPLAMVAVSAPQVIWGPRFDWQITGFLKSIGWLLLALLIAYGAFRLGLRNREVVLTGGDVEIRWGQSRPLTLHRYDATSLTNFTVTKEKRIALSARPSSGHYGSQQMPDRWRLTATANGHNVDLGSYTTEAAAKQAIASIQTAQ